MRRSMPLFIASLTLQAPFLLAPQAALSEPTVSAPTVFPLHDALINDRKTTHAYTVSAVDVAGRHVTLKWQEGPGAKTRFEGKPAKTYLATYTTSIDGSETVKSNDVQYFSAADDELLGSKIITTGKAGTRTHYSVVLRSRPLPKSARIGDAGPGGLLMGYSDPDRAHLIDRRQVTWSLQRDPASPDNALFCERQVLQFAATHDSMQIATECFHENSAGIFSAPIELQESSTTLH
jgi:hypothetical protein